MSKAIKLFNSQSSSGSYLSTNLKVIKPQLDFINEILHLIEVDTINEKTGKKKSVKLIEREIEDNRKFYCHLIVSTLAALKKNKDGWIPISSVFIEKNIPKCSWFKFVDKGLLEVSTYSHFKGLSREFRIPDFIFDEFFEKQPLDLTQLLTTKRYDAFTGRASNVALGHQRFDENGNEEPESITSALDLIKEGYFNLAAVTSHIKDLNVVRLSLKAEYARIAADETSTEEAKKLALKRYKKAKCRLINDHYAIGSIIGQNPKEIAPGIYVYKPAYKVQPAGRVSQMKGGLQSASRKAKAAAYKGIQNLKNYDLKASQVNGLIQQFELANLNTTWLIQYRDNPNAKKEYAAKVGVSVDCWKTCLCALLFGAYTTSPSKVKSKLDGLLEEGGKPLNSILDTLENEANGDLELLINYQTKFLECVKPLKEQLDIWHNWLLDKWVPAVAYSAKNGKKYIENPTGKKLCIDDLQAKYKVWKVKSKLAAFVMQGQEAAFIHALTNQSVNYDYKVIANEHDGLICIGIIPDEAVQKAAEMSGLKTPTLEEKPFDLTEIEELLEEEDDNTEYDWEEDIKD
ncbi:hypothetical protein A2T98_13075 [Nodularia spumigena CENA596]|uniref:DNA-directed DNA polymerase family A palm domain-containing protein n=1 Tax=Nodularia spumigena CENA596 TaxID=1819295 RepID=A0A161VQL7_NODSP|nr:hypothetical protein [Nodularia spumigena]KZL49345.1 hypothetical protein A2T98_13075 [Nodularia spumigena CENA596]